MDLQDCQVVMDKQLMQYLPQQELFEAEAEVDARNWEKRNSDFASHEINQEFESQRFQLHQASRWADQAQRDKTSLYGELEMRNGLFQEDHARDCQEIEELRRTCCEDASRARQARIDELSMYQERNPATESQLLTQIQELQDNVRSLSDAREFYDPESGSSSGATHVPDQISTILSSRTLPRCDSGLPRNTQNCTGMTGNVFERPSAQEGVSSTIFNISKNLHHPLRNSLDTAETARREWNEKRIVEYVSPFTIFPKWRWYVESYWWNLFYSGMMDYPRIPMTGVRLGKFPDSMEFPSWKVNFKTEV